MSFTQLNLREQRAHCDHWHGPAWAAGSQMPSRPPNIEGSHGGRSCIALVEGEVEISLTLPKFLGKFAFRPAFNALHKAAARREFDVVMAWSVDRLGRSLQDLVSFLSEIHASGVDLFLHQQGIDTTTPGGKAMFQMLGVFAAFERSIIQERVRAGLRRAKAEGKQLGRPRIAADIEARISAALKARKDTGDSVRKIAARIGVDPSTVQRISRPFDAAA
jgi:DNA invertase Pin-like site-specific DNA recombinase